MVCTPSQIPSIDFIYTLSIVWLVPLVVSSFTFSFARVIDAREIMIIPATMVIPKNFTPSDIATLLFSRFTTSLSRFSMYFVIDVIIRSAAAFEPAKILQSSANLQNGSPRLSSSLSNSSNTTLLSNGLSGLPWVITTALSWPDSPSTTPKTLRRGFWTSSISADLSDLQSLTKIHFRLSDQFALGFLQIPHRACGFRLMSASRPVPQTFFGHPCLRLYIPSSQGCSRFSDDSLLRMPGARFFS